MATTEAQPEVKAPSTKAKQSSLYVGRFSVSGPRPYNEDNIDVRRTSKRLIALVADGMGGGEVGASVSDQAIKFAAESLQEARDDTNVGAQIRQAFSLAHQSARNFRLMGQRYAKSGSTLVCAVLEATSHGMVAHVGNIGDSRVYRVRGKQVTQLSTDHNRYEQMLAQGVPDSEARKDPQARKLTYCLGTSNDIASAPNLYTQHELQPGDTLLLCSDGVGEFVNDADIISVLNANPVEKAAQKIVEKALANGGNDNTSAVVIGYGRRRGGVPLPLIAMLLALLAVGAGVGTIFAAGGKDGPAPLLVDGNTVTPVPTELQAQASSTALALVTSTFAAPPTWSPTPSATPVVVVPQRTLRPGETARPTARPATPLPGQPTSPPAQQPTSPPVQQPTNPPVQPTNPPVQQPTNPPVQPTNPPVQQPTKVPPTDVPLPTKTSVAPPTAVPPTAVPPTAVPPTDVPPTAVPPTAVPPTAVPPTAVPPTAVPPTAVPPTAVPPTEPIRNTPTSPPSSRTP